jgi:hypothetical protein
MSLIYVLEGFLDLLGGDDIPRKAKFVGVGRVLFWDGGVWVEKGAERVKC